VPLVLIVSAVDANFAERWAERHGSDNDPPAVHGRGLVIPLAIAWGMLTTGFAALVLSLVELRWRTNRFENLVFILVLVPVGGLLTHLVVRVMRQLTGTERSTRSRRNASG